MNDNFLIKRGHFTPLAILFMILLPLVTALICICLGRMNVPVGDVIAVFRDVLTGNEGHAQNYSIVINLRLPRILMAIIVGAGLTCAGNTFQSLFSNPLATPDILGVTSGTCVGAILAIILSCGILETQLIALAFGLASVFFTLKIAGKNENRSMVYLVLAGVIAEIPMVNLADRLMCGESGEDLASLCCRRHGETVVQPIGGVLKEIDGYGIPVVSSPRACLIERDRLRRGDPQRHTLRYEVIASRRGRES